MSAVKRDSKEWKEGLLIVARVHTLGMGEEAIQDVARMLAEVREGKDLVQ